MEQKVQSTPKSQALWAITNGCRAPGRRFTCALTGGSRLYVTERPMAIRRESNTNQQCKYSNIGLYCSRTILLPCACVRLLNPFCCPDLRSVYLLMIRTYGFIIIHKSGNKNGGDANGFQVRKPDYVWLLRIQIMYRCKSKSVHQTNYFVWHIYIFCRFPQHAPRSD